MSVIRAYYKQFLFVVIIVFVTSCYDNNRDIESKELLYSDSILFYSNQSLNLSLEKNLRQVFLNQGIKCLTNKNISDSIRNFYTLELSYSAYLLKDIDNFNHLIDKSIQYSSSLKDTLSLARAYRYKGYYSYYFGSKLDAYKEYHLSQKLYSKKGDAVRSTMLLYSLALTQLDLHQYNGAENDVYRALEMFIELNNNEGIYICYSLLGGINKDVKNYARAIKYYSKSKEYINKQDSLSFATIENNIGAILYAKNEYKKAIRHYSNALKYKSLKKASPILYYKIIDNINYAKYKANIHSYATAIELLESNYTYRQDIDDVAGVIANRLYISDVYSTQKDISKSISTAQRALQLSTNSNNNTLKLKSLTQLINIDTLNYKKYFGMFLSLKDTMEVNDRKVRSELGRVRMQTNEYITKSKALTQVNYGLFFSLAVLMLVFIFVYIHLKQRIKLIRIIKEKELKEKVNRLLAEEKVNISKAKKKVNDSIAKELHDNILSKVFAVRYNLELYSNEKIVEYINTLREIEYEIREVSHELKRGVDTDISKAIETLLHDTLSQTQIKYSYKDTFDRWRVVDDGIKTNIYRIAQESLSNILKHSKSNNVSISFSNKEKYLIFDIIDDGIGFDTKRKYKGKGIGVLNIEERAKNIDATLKITSSKNKGTVIHLSIPVPYITVSEMYDF